MGTQTTEDESEPKFKIGQAVLYEGYEDADKKSRFDKEFYIAAVVKLEAGYHYYLVWVDEEHGRTHYFSKNFEGRISEEEIRLDTENDPYPFPEKLRKDVFSRFEAGDPVKVDQVGRRGIGPQKDPEWLRGTVRKLTLTETWGEYSRRIYYEIVTPTGDLIKAHPSDTYYDETAVPSEPS